MSQRPRAARAKAGDGRESLLAVHTETYPPELVQMQGSYAVILRRSALATAPVAAAMIVLSAIAGGSKGLIGALLGVGLVLVFFGIDAIALSWAARRSPQTMMVTAITTYLVKILALLVLVAKTSGTSTAFNGKLFGLTVVVCVIVWTTALAVVTARLKVAYVEPGVQQPKVPYAHQNGQEPAILSAELDGNRPKVPYAEPDGKR